MGLARPHELNTIGYIEYIINHVLKFVILDYLIYVQF